MLPFGMSWRLSGSLSKPVMCSVNWFACAQMDVRMAQMESRPLQWRHEQFRLTVDHSGGVCFSNTSQNYSQEFIQSDDAFQKSFFFFAACHIGEFCTHHQELHLKGIFSMISYALIFCHNTVFNRNLAKKPHSTLTSVI